MPRPHKLLTGMADKLIDGAKSAGAAVMGALDKPPSELGGPQGVHNIPHRVADGIANSVKATITGVANAMDHPGEQFGVPPDLDLGRGGSLRPPRFGR